MQKPWIILPQTSLSRTFHAQNIRKIAYGMSHQPTAIRRHPQPTFLIVIWRFSIAINFLIAILKRFHRLLTCWTSCPGRTSTVMDSRPSIRRACKYFFSLTKYHQSTFQVGWSLILFFTQNLIQNLSDIENRQPQQNTHMSVKNKLQNVLYYNVYVGNMMYTL